MITKEHQLAHANIMIRSCAESEFWGELTFKFERGTIVHMRKIQNLKMPDVPGHEVICVSSHTGGGESTEQ